VEKVSTKKTFVLKTIYMGEEGTTEREKSQKEVDSEIRVGMTISRECLFLVRYEEIFYHNNYCCLILEYCSNGDLQQELDKGRKYEEDVLFIDF
jgi:serine/threonine protein kinase